MISYPPSSGGSKVSAAPVALFKNSKIDGGSKVNNKATVKLSASGKGSAETLPTTKSSTIAVGLQTASCNLFPPKHPNLASAITPELRKLAQYEQLCNGALADRSSFFAPTPTNTSSAISDASDMASRLKDYASNGVKPLVFLEPDDGNGNNLDLNQYRAGAYNSALDNYFSDLKNAGITDEMMGEWVILPEGNIPEWDSVDPGTFAADVTLTVQYQKKYFPSSLASIMLDSETYPSATSWSNGAYASLVPYVQGIPKGLIDSFGLQGFPWAPPANQGGGGLYNPLVYLRVDLAAQAARTLGVSNIWLNTGTFNQSYTNSPAETVTLTPVQRQTMLNGIIAQARLLQAQGFTTEVHLFAQNKSSTSEAIDWSYWQSTPSNVPNTEVFTDFVHGLKTSNIPLWLFDTY